MKESQKKVSNTFLKTKEVPSRAEMSTEMMQLPQETVLLETGHFRPWKQA